MFLQRNKKKIIPDLSSNNYPRIITKYTSLISLLEELCLLTDSGSATGGIDLQEKTEYIRDTE